MNGDLVSRSALIKKMFPYGMPDNGNYGINARAVMEALTKEEAVEAEPVVHARWLFDEDDDGNWFDKCSGCGGKLPNSCGYCCDLPRCPYCGAVMDEEVADGT